ERADLWALGLELFLFLIFLASMGSLLPLVLQTWEGWILVVGTLVAGLLMPLALHLGIGEPASQRMTAAAWFALTGGFMLRFGIVTIAPALLTMLNAPQLAQERLKALDAPLYSTWTGITLIALTVLLSCAIPMFLQKQWKLSAPRTALACVVSSL